MTEQVMDYQEEPPYPLQFTVGMEVLLCKIVPMLNSLLNRRPVRAEDRRLQQLP